MLVLAKPVLDQRIGLDHLGVEITNFGGESGHRGSRRRLTRQSGVLSLGGSQGPGRQIIGAAEVAIAQPARQALSARRSAAGVW